MPLYTRARSKCRVLQSVNQVLSYACAALCTMGNNPNRCAAYESFEKLIERVESNYLSLNPVDGGLFEHVGISDCELDERGSEFVRAGIVTAMSAWDVYVHSLFEEAFTLVMDVFTRDEKSLENLRKQWPACDAIIENEKRLQQETLRAEGHVEESQVSEAATQLDVEECKKLLAAHCDRVVYQRALLPVFDCEGVFRGPRVTIDEMFQQLFRSKAEKSLSEMLIEVCGRNDYYGLRTTNDCTYRVTLKPDLPSDRSTVKTLCALSCVHYFLRCALVNDASFFKEWSDSDTTYDIALSNQNHSDVKAYYEGLGKEIGEKMFRDSDINVSYLALLNVTRYLRFVALSLMRAVAQWFYDLQPEENPEERECIWGYPPTGKRQPEKDSCTLL